MNAKQKAAGDAAAKQKEEELADQGITQQHKDEQISAARHGAEKEEKKRQQVELSKSNKDLRIKEDIFQSKSGLHQRAAMQNETEKKEAEVADAAERAAKEEAVAAAATTQAQETEARDSGLLLNTLGNVTGAVTSGATAATAQVAAGGAMALSPVEKWLRGEGEQKDI